MGKSKKRKDKAHLPLHFILNEVNVIDGLDRNRLIKLSMWKLQSAKVTPKLFYKPVSRF